MASTSTIPVPAVVHKFFSKFPLYTYPQDESASIQSAARQTRPTLWIAPPRFRTDVLSADVECLKWQAYIALRGVKNIGVEWDVSPEGAVDGRLPSLVVYERGKLEVMGSRMIPGWVDGLLQVEEDAFEGYKDAAAKDESRAWVTLLEGTVESALRFFNPPPVSITSLLLYSSHPPVSHSSQLNKPRLSILLSPPPAPLSGLTSLFPPYGERVSPSSMQSQYYDAIVSLSHRLGQDMWFLGSSGPTALDALLFAFLHCLLAAPDDLRLPVARRMNLVNYERRVREIVRASFVAVQNR
ncbi:hypothetical protein A7U60_g8809 [Sanghuangporus baumii]|uniref:Metaxin glutathione S-transferase domain-containing protein n=1 Tax=Sanghuangporus baumii TaxID=108892 RepID=A0A9Q5MXL3_SANBA|nr:hypothetical protein A7U60_g8809 [Sanghuangporus baumii]